MSSYMDINFEPGPFDRMEVEVSELFTRPKPWIVLRFMEPLGDTPEGTTDYRRKVRIDLSREQLQAIVAAGQNALAQYDALVPIIEQKREVEQRGKELKS